MIRRLSALAALTFFTLAAAPAFADPVKAAAPDGDPSQDRILVKGANPELDAAREEKATLESKLAHINALLASGSDRPADQIERLHQAADAYHAAIAKADERIRLAEKKAAPVHTAKPADLSKDPIAAGLADEKLRLVNEHMARLRDLLDKLRYPGSDAEKTWNEAVKHNREIAREQYEAGIDGLTAGLSQALGALQGRTVAAAKDNAAQAFEELTKERSELEALAADPSLAGSPDLPRLQKMIGAMKTLDAAQTRASVGEQLGDVREAIGVLSDQREQALAGAASPAVADKLYHASVVLGVTASAFAKQPMKEAAAPVDTIIKVGEGGVLMREGWQQDREFAALSAQSYQRHQTELDLQKKMAGLEEEQKRLEWAQSH